MDTETEIVIQQEPIAPSTEVVIDKGKADAVPAKVITADEGVADLKEQVARAKADSERRLNEANRQIEAARQRAVAAETEVAVVRKDAVSTLVDSLNKDKESARRDFKAAMEAGDFDKAGEAQDRLSLANARIVEAERGKVELEAQAKAPRQVAQPDQVEQMAQAVGGRSGDWIRQHPEFARDPGKTADMERAHFAALGEGIRVESDDYFAFVNDRLGITKREPSAGRDVSRTPTAAPVSRDVTQSPGAKRPGTVRLTESEVSTAKALDMSLEEYARNKMALIAEGKIGRVAN